MAMRTAPRILSEEISKWQILKNRIGNKRGYCPPISPKTGPHHFFFMFGSVGTVGLVSGIGVTFNGFRNWDFRHRGSLVLADSAVIGRQTSVEALSRLCQRQRHLLQL